MTSITRLGLGCMSMNMANRERSIECVRYALDSGVTMLNTGEFYGAGESEMVLGEALRGVPRDSYFISVKFGVLPQPAGGIYGLDVNPFNVKAHLAYSMHRLGLDYIDLYQPARMDESVPVEELMGVLSDLVGEGYIGSIGLTQLSADDLRRAAQVHPIKMVELAFSVADRSIEDNGILSAARDNHIDVLAFAVLSHGLLSDTAGASQASGRRVLSPEQREHILSGLRQIATGKETSVENLLQAYVWAKHPDMSILIGTTRKEHLKDSIDALSITLTEADVQAIEAAFPAGALAGMGMRDIAFRDGRIVRA